MLNNTDNTLIQVLSIQKEGLNTKNFDMALKTAEQLRAARALLDLKQSDVAEMSGVSKQSVARLENETGPLGIQMATLDKLQTAFRKAGVRFIGDGEASPDGGPGVRLEESGD